MSCGFLKEETRNELRQRETASEHAFDGLFLGKIWINDTVYADEIFHS